MTQQNLARATTVAKATNVTFTQGEIQILDETYTSVGALTEACRRDRKRLTDRGSVMLPILAGSFNRHFCEYYEEHGQQIRAAGGIVNATQMDELIALWGSFQILKRILESEAEAFSSLIVISIGNSLIRQLSVLFKAFPHA